MDQVPREPASFFRVKQHTVHQNALIDEFKVVEKSKKELRKSIN